MAYKKISTYTDEAGYKPVYYDEATQKVCNYSREVFDDKRVMLDFLEKQPQKHKGYVRITMVRAIYFPESTLKEIK